MRHALRLEGFNGKIKRHPWYGWLPERLVILADQLLKQPAVHFFRASMGTENGWRWHREKIGQFKTRDQVDDATVLRELGNEAILFDKTIRAMGSRFVFLLLPPDRGSIPNDRRYDEFVRNLQMRGISVVGFLPNEKWPKGYPDWFWQKYDSHWTENGIELTAKKLLDEAYGSGWDKKSKSP